MHREKQTGHTRTANDTSGGFASALKNSIYGVLISLIIALVLVFISAAVCYSNDDPDKLTAPLALISLYVTSLTAGFISVHKNKGSALLCGIISGVFLSVFFIIFSIISGDSQAITSSFPASFGLRALIVAFSIFGAYLGLNFKKSGKGKRKRR